MLAWLILRGRVGRAFRAVRDSEIAAVSSGVELPVYKTLAFGISAAYAGVAGSLFVLALNGFAQPSEFDVFLSLQILVGAAVAGLGSLWGILVGAAFVGLLPQVSSERAGDRRAARPRRRFRGGGHPVMLLLPDGFAGLLATDPPARPCLNRESISIKLLPNSSLETQSESEGHIHACQP